MQPGTDAVDPLPLHGEALRGEEHLLGHGDPVPHAGMVSTFGERGGEPWGCGARGGLPSSSLPTLLAMLFLLEAAVAAGGLGPGLGVEQHVLPPQQLQLAG